MPNPFGEEWEEMYKRYNQSMEFLNFLDPEGLMNYLSIDAVIKKRMFPNIGTKEAFQEAFEMLVEGVLPDEKKTLEYVNKIIETGQSVGLDLKLSETLKRQLERRGEQQEETVREQRRQQIVRTEGKPLEEQLQDAIAAEDYEEAEKLKKQIERIRRMRGLDPETGGRPTTAADKYKGTLHLGDME